MNHTVKVISLARSLDRRNTFSRLNAHIDFAYFDAIEGARNRREYSSVTFAGETFETLSALCRAYDKDANVVRRRISGGWSLADAIAKPVKHKKTVNRRNARKVEYKGTTYKSIADLARNYKVNYSRVLDRLRRGDTIEEAMIREDRRKNT